MKLNFTRLGMFLCLLIGSAGMYAQQANAVVITEPASIAGIYRAIQPTPIWGTSLDSSLSGTATFSNDGLGNTTDACDSPIENVTGKIAFVDRGNCAFTLKALNAQNGGAVAVVICNNNANGGIQNMPAGNEAGQITIPAFAMSLSDCAKIRIEAETGDVDVTLAYQCEVQPDADVIWGNEPGQGDFSNGLGDWYVEKDDGSDTTWYWTLDRVVPGRYTTNTHVVEGTACNGFMVFPSDFYDNNGEYLIPDVPGSGPNSGAGLCPNGGLQGDFCTGSLFSPVIDLSGQDPGGLFCRFYHDWGYYYAGSTSLIVSFDGGETWPDTTYVTLGERAGTTLNQEVTISGECQVSTSSVNDRGESLYTIPITGYDGQGSVQLQFRHLGGYYHATIDDVVLLGGGFADIEVLRSFVGRAPAQAIPVSQANAIPLHVDIFNRGNTPATDVQIMAEATGPDGSVEWSTVNDSYMDQPAYCFLNENSSFTDLFTPTQEGNYTMTYRNVTAGDPNMANDTVSFGFEMTENIWRSVTRPEADEDGQYNQLWSGLISDDPADDGFCGYDYAVAYTFYLPNGKGNFLNTVRFGINELAGNSGSVRIYLYLWDPSTESLTPDANRNYAITAGERILLGCMGKNSFGEIQNRQPMNAILGAQDDLTLRMAVADPATGSPRLDNNGELIPIELQDDQHYALVFVVDPDQENELEFIAGDSGDGSANDLQATNFALGNIGATQRYGSSIVCPLNNNGDFETELSSLDFLDYWPSNQAWIEMNIGPENTSTEDITPESLASLEVFPNPATNVLVMDINLDNVSPQVAFELVNVNGEIVKRTLESNVKQGRFTMSVGELASGIYTLNARSEAGFVAKKVVITK